MTDSARLFFFPYCIKLRADGTYIILNRRYKPVGFVGSEQVVYEDYPVGFLPKTAPELAFSGLSWDPENANFEQIYLYSDQCIPTKSKANWKAYAKRLDLLAHLEIKTFPKAGSPGTTRNFERWLLQYIGENSAIGDIAGDVQRDNSFPSLSDSMETADFHLALRSAGLEASSALQEAWELYCADAHGAGEPHIA